MTRLFRSPRCSLAALCGILGTFLVVGFSSAGRTDGGRAQIPAFTSTFDGSEEAADQSSSRQAARVLRGTLLSKAGVERWHRAGFRGKGVAVAVLDTGFRGLREQRGKSLPEKVTARSFRLDGNLEARDSQHGILCAEVVHALAPEAELLLANWEPDSPQSFLDAVRWARAQGARVITCSVIMPSWGDGEGGGPVHAELARTLGGDVLCFASAGNTANRTWTGTFHDAGNGYHEWREGVISNPLTPWGTDRVSIELCWKGAADFEVLVEDAVTGKVVTMSAPVDAPRHSVQARFDPVANRSYRVQVRQLRGRPCAFHCTALASGLEFATPSGSVCFPADGPAVIAVGAVDADGRRMTYSSCGPNSAQPKPDLVAIVPFPSLWRERPFSGTSAASPQAAALAALWCCRHPDWTAAKVRQQMCKTARDLGPPGHDSETGYGLIQLPAE
jgi:hypothetical protein